MYDERITLRNPAKPWNNPTVLELRATLAKLPDDFRVTVCGADGNVYLHVDHDDKVVTIDNEDLAEEYPELSYDEDDLEDMTDDQLIQLVLSSKASGPVVANLTMDMVSNELARRLGLSTRQYQKVLEFRDRILALPRSFDDEVDPETFDVTPRMAASLLRELNTGEWDAAWPWFDEARRLHVSALPRSPGVYMYTLNFWNAANTRCLTYNTETEQISGTNF